LRGFYFLFMIYLCCCCFEIPKELWWTILGAVLSGGVTFLLVYYFRPCICIKTPSLVAKHKGEPDKKKIKIPVCNKRRFTSAINIKIEANFISNNKTFHLELDRDNFLIIPKAIPCENNNSRTFQAIDIDGITRKFFEPEHTNISFEDFLRHNTIINSTFRVRVYAQHEFTGFGKTFEAKFTFDGNNFKRMD
jgi:hypothetical protein